MNGEHVNGAPVEDLPSIAEPAAAAQPAFSQTKAEETLDVQIKQLVGCTMRGIMASAPGIPPHLVLESIARVTGQLLAGAIQADLSTHFIARKAFKDNFVKGIGSAPMGQMPAPDDLAKALKHPGR